jgi:hypothetical protein
MDDALVCLGSRLCSSSSSLSGGLTRARRSCVPELLPADAGGFLPGLMAFHISATFGSSASDCSLVMAEGERRSVRWLRTESTLTSVNGPLLRMPLWGGTALPRAPRHREASVFALGEGGGSPDPTLPRERRAVRLAGRVPSPPRASTCPSRGEGTPSPITPQVFWPVLYLPEMEVAGYGSWRVTPSRAVSPVVC